MLQTQVMRNVRLLDKEQLVEMQDPTVATISATKSRTALMASLYFLDGMLVLFASAVTVCTVAF